MHKTIANSKLTLSTFQFFLTNMTGKSGQVQHWAYMRMQLIDISYVVQLYLQITAFVLFNKATICIQIKENEKQTFMSVQHCMKREKSKLICNLTGFSKKKKNLRIAFSFFENNLKYFVDAIKKYCVITF